MVGHFIEKCRVCDVTTSQCKCPAKDKEIRYTTCNKCSQEAIKKNEEKDTEEPLIEIRSILRKIRAGIHTSAAKEYLTLEINDKFIAGDRVRGPAEYTMLFRFPRIDLLKALGLGDCDGLNEDEIKEAVRAFKYLRDIQS